MMVVLCNKPSKLRLVALLLSVSTMEKTLTAPVPDHLHDDDDDDHDDHDGQGVDTKDLSSMDNKYMENNIKNNDDGNGNEISPRNKDIEYDSDKVRIVRTPQLDFVYAGYGYDHDKDDNTNDEEDCKISPCNKDIDDDKGQC